MFFRQQKYRNKIEKFHSWATWHLNADKDFVEYVLYLSNITPEEKDCRFIWKTIELLLRVEEINYDY
tara:strand:- start:133 stop:333 length:201 start_codon:yes stop_codon:yes gene_type:complete